MPEGGVTTKHGVHVSRDQCSVKFQLIHLCRFSFALLSRVTHVKILITLLELFVR